MLQITSRLAIPDSEFEWSYVRASGPGGQNVNKVASKAVLRWNAVASPSLTDEVKQRFLEQQRPRLTTEGDLLITSQRFRDQEKNRTDCLEKLTALIRQALHRPKVRRPTKPTRSSQRARLEDKRHRTARKSGRRSVGDE